MVKSKRYVPKRGDVVWLAFDPQAGRRPALVLSPEAYNTKVGLALFCSITSQKKGYPFEVDIPGGLRVSGVVLADQVKSLDWRARDATLICELPAQTTAEALEKLGTLLSKLAK